MATDTSLYLHVGNLTNIGGPDLSTDSSTPLYRPGGLNFSVDAFGPRVFKYVRNRSGSAAARGELLAYDSDAANVISFSVANITAGTTTSATTSGLTASDHQGKIANVLDNDDSAGAAPEGQSSIVADNTATKITMEADYPFSVALAANDDLELLATWQVEDAAASDEAWTVAGVVVGNDGISDGNYGWVQIEGAVSADIDTALVTDGDALIAGAAVLADPAGASAAELRCAIAMVAVSADQVAQTCPVMLKLFTCGAPASA